MKFTFVLLFLSISMLGQAQIGEDAILAPIKNMFDGMRAGDSSMVHSAFHPEARMNTVSINKDDEKTLSTGSLERFLNAVGTPHEDVWNEVIWSYEVQQDGLLASVWTEYTFYAGERMSHCGVNVFQMFDSKDGWKIIQITDTRRKTNCKQKIN